MTSEILRHELYAVRGRIGSRVLIRSVGSTYSSQCLATKVKGIRLLRRHGHEILLR